MDSFSRLIRGLLIAALFILIAVVAWLGLAIIGGMFLGTLSIPLQAFDIIRKFPGTVSETNGIVFLVYMLLCVGSLLSGLYVSFAFTTHYVYRDDAKTERLLKPVMMTVMWMMYSFFHTIWISIVSLTAVSSFLRTPLDTEVMESQFRDARWILLMAVICAYVLAADSVRRNFRD